MLWGGRFSKELNTRAMEFSSSLSYDILLIEEDVACSIAHSTMLSEIGILTVAEATAIKTGLLQILDDYNSGKWVPDSAVFEDIHSAIESRLTELIGEPGGKLHTGRSRNDQVATDLVLYLRKALKHFDHGLVAAISVLLDLAETHKNVLMPGYTHMQRAQVITLGYHLLAYAEMLTRDRERVTALLARLRYSPLGSGAIAGSTLPLDRDKTAELLGFIGPTFHAMDTIASRDYAVEFLNIANIGMLNLSRLAEEIILWSGSEWAFIKLSDDFTTGSSLMPQKKNPDMAELIRGKSGRTLGNYVQLSTVIKGLPLSYNRDLQEDKESLFDSFKTYYDSLSLLAPMLATAVFNTSRFDSELKGDFMAATDLADYLVIKGVPFRVAHHTIGKVVSYCEVKGKTLKEITIEELQTIDTHFESDVFSIILHPTPPELKQTIGSPASNQIDNIISRLRSLL